MLLMMMLVIPWWFPQTCCQWVLPPTCNSRKGSTNWFHKGPRYWRGFGPVTGCVATFCSRMCQVSCLSHQGSLTIDEFFEGLQEMKGLPAPEPQLRCLVEYLNITHCLSVYLSIYFFFFFFFLSTSEQVYVFILYVYIFIYYLSLCFFLYRLNKWYICRMHLSILNFNYLIICRHFYRYSYIRYYVHWPV